MSFTQAISVGFKKYAEFTGVASRSEYWWWVLFTVLVSLALSALWDALGVVWSFAVLLPSLAVGVRRLRDAGYRWTWLFISLVPLVGAIVLIVFLTQPSKGLVVDEDVTPGRVPPEV